MCRDATVIETSKALAGFPVWLLPAIAAHVEHLARKAIPTSRSKRAY
jgi:hypothetical protein